MQVIDLTCVLVLQVWVERFREWMSKQVLQQLLLAAEQANQVDRSFSFCCAILHRLHYFLLETPQYTHDVGIDNQISPLNGAVMLPASTFQAASCFWQHFTHEVACMRLNGHLVTPGGI